MRYRPRMIKARRAGPADAVEIVRLRGVMLASMDGAEPPPGGLTPTLRLSLPPTS